MDRNTQKEFVDELLTEIGKDIKAKIDSGKIPEGWDGHELRALIRDKAADSADLSQIISEPRGKRAREYRSTCLRDL